MIVILIEHIYNEANLLGYLTQMGYHDKSGKVR